MNPFRVQAFLIAESARGRGKTGRAVACRRAMTLIEVMIVVVMLGILAAIVFPKYQSLDADARAKSAASNVRLVRELIQIHRHSGIFAVGAAGWPLAIESDWFRGKGIPEHAWTTEEMQVATVSAGAAVRYPAAKTFDISNETAKNAWYNTDNGRFCVLVPPRATDEETLALFNLANSCELLDLSQTD